MMKPRERECPGWRRAKTGRQIPRHGAGRNLRRMISVLFALALLHVVSMAIFEDLHPFDSLWLTMTTLTTVGYGDFSATTIPGRISTMVLVFMGGIWTDFQSAALYFE